jgi:hypothetical protein
MVRILTAHPMPLPQFGLNEEVSFKFVLAETPDGRQAVHYALLPRRFVENGETLPALRHRVLDEGMPLVFPIAATLFRGLDPDRYVCEGRGSPSKTRPISKSATSITRRSWRLPAPPC